MITVVAATRLEAQAARKAVGGGAQVVQAGIALSRGRQYEGAAISCGIAGALRTGLRTGSVLVPRSVLRPDETLLQCDEELTQALARAAEQLGYEPVDAPLLTSARLVHGDERSRWASKGYAGVDMETGLIDASRIACVRVVLDTPEREISPAWQRPSSVFVTPAAWRDLPFLAREGPRCAQIAAEIVGLALRSAVRSSAAR